MDDTQAKQRFVLIALARFASVLLLVLGLSLALGDTGDSPWLGYALVLLGMAGVFWVPKFLAGRWRTPDE